MPRTSDAKARVVQTAAWLFSRRGYNGVGVAEIIEASGAPKGSFYHHFPGGKEEVAEGAVRLAAQQTATLIDRAFADAPDFAAGAAALAACIGEHLARSGWQNGCPVMAVVVDAVPGSARLSVAVREALDGWVAKVTDHGTRLGLPPGAAGLKAERFLTALEGAWLLARIRRSTEPFQVAAEAAR